MTLVVLAAGMGSRYGGLKQIDPVGPSGEFIIDFSVYDAVRAGYDKVVFIIKRENYDVFRSTIGTRLEHAIKVDYAFQELNAEQAAQLPADRTKPLGTAHALLCARDKISGNFAVINADDYYGVDAFRIAKEYLDAHNQTDEDSHFCMVGYKLANTLTENGSVSRGICEATEDGTLLSIAERTKIRVAGADAEYLEEDVWHPLSGDSVASMNFFGFTPKIFEPIVTELDKFLKDETIDRMKGECYLPIVTSEAVKQGLCDVKVLVTPDKWFGVTYQEDRPTVVENFKKLADAGVYPADGLWK
ncbi:MAG: nucleotidyltransferase [Clostridia bacterium]|nr:nucleotidyltransferase [Clostridia bacterium]